MPTHERLASLGRVLEALTQQSCPPSSFSVVVVCDACTDGSAEMLRSARYPFEIKVLEQTQPLGPAAARNRALASIESPIVIFLDDDVIPQPRLVEVHAAHHAANLDEVVIGPLLPQQGRQQPWIRWEAETLARQYDEMRAGEWEPTPRQFYTGNASVRRQHLVEAGAFNPRLKRGEDVDLAFRLQRLGLRFVFEPEAWGIHIARRSFRSWFDAAREYGRVESLMGPVWGTNSLVDVKLVEFRRRHPLVRRTVQFSIANPDATSVLVGAGRGLARLSAALGIWPVARGAYTALFEVAYWAGVDEASDQRGLVRKRIDAPA